jgi:hypothetical protein
MPQKQYNIKPLLIALGILLLLVLAYGAFLLSQSDVSGIKNINKPKSAEPAVISPAQKEQEERTEKALEALEAMKEGERKVPTIMDRERTAGEHEAALKALEAMKRPGGSVPMPAQQQADQEKTIGQQQAALDALEKMQSQ